MGAEALVLLVVADAVAEGPDVEEVCQGEDNLAGLDVVDGLIDCADVVLVEDPVDDDPEDEEM